MQNKQINTNEIFAKEVVTIEDLQILYNLSYSSAAKFMRELKVKGDRLNLKGRIHKLDYFLNLNIDPKLYEKAVA